MTFLTIIEVGYAPHVNWHLCVNDDDDDDDDDDGDGGGGGGDGGDGGGLMLYFM